MRKPVSLAGHNTMETILFIDDEPIRAFELAKKALSWYRPTLIVPVCGFEQVQFWMQRPMVDKVNGIMLDHDMPFNGMEVAKLIAGPFDCRKPILIHSANTQGAVSIYNYLHECGWNSQKLGLCSVLWENWEKQVEAWFQE